MKKNIRVVKKITITFLNLIVFFQFLFYERKLNNVFNVLHWTIDIQNVCFSAKALFLGDFNN